MTVEKSCCSLPLYDSPSVCSRCYEQDGMTFIRSGCPRCGYPELEVSELTGTVYCPFCYLQKDEWQRTEDDE